MYETGLTIVSYVDLVFELTSLKSFKAISLNSLNSSKDPVNLSFLVTDVSHPIKLTFLLFLCIKIILVLSDCVMIFDGPSHVLRNGYCDLQGRHMVNKSTAPPTSNENCSLHH